MIETLLLAANETVRKYTGFRLKREPVSFDDVRARLIKDHQIDLLIDGGANDGQWALRTQKLLRGKDGALGVPNVMSFEPAQEAYERLETKAKALNPNGWKTIHRALGSRNETRSLHIAGNGGQSSSLRKPKDHLTEYKTVPFDGLESVRVVRLDEVAEVGDYASIYLKLDVQGFEADALQGCKRILEKIKVLEVESSFREMYSGQSSHREILELIESNGFQVKRFSDAGLSADGEVLYTDILAAR